MSATFSLLNTVAAAHTAIAVTVSTRIASTPSTPATTPRTRRLRFGRLGSWRSRRRIDGHIRIEGDVVVATLQVRRRVIAAFLPTCAATAGGDIPPARGASDLRSRSCRARSVARWRCPACRPGVVLFASAQDEPRARRPTDLAMAIASRAPRRRRRRCRPSAANLDDALANLLATFPRVLRPAVDGRCSGRRWCGRSSLFGAALVRRRRGLPRDVLGGVAVVAAHRRRRRRARRTTTRGACCGCSPTSTARRRSRRRAHRRDGRDLHGVAPPQPPVPPLRPVAHRPAVRSARCSSAPRRPRAASPPSPSACSPPPPCTSSSARPAGRPTTSRIQLALRGPRRRRSTTSRRRRCTAEGDGAVRRHRPDGPLSVKVYGRDAWDGQLLANLWRLAWYRGTQRTVRLQPARARRARGVRHPAGRAGRRAGAAPRHGGQRRPGRRPRRRPPRRRAAARRATGARRRRGDRRAVGATSTACTTPASPTAGSTSTASSPATTARSASATCRRRRSPPTVADRAPGPGAGARRRPCCSSARSGPPPRPGAPSATTGRWPCCPTSRRRRCRRACATRSTRRDIELDDVRGRLRDLLGAPRAAAHPAAPGHAGARCSTWPCWRIAAYTLIGVFSDIDLDVVRRRPARRQLVRGWCSPSCSPRSPASRPR